MNKETGYKNGDKAYIVESNRVITEVIVDNIQGGFCIAKYGLRNESAIRIRLSRLYKTRVEAEENLQKYRKKPVGFFQR